MPDPKHPMQLMFLEEDGRPRFKANSLVLYMLDAGGLDLSGLRMLPNIPQEDWEQFYQLIGYPLSGFEELSFVGEDAIMEARKLADDLKVRKGPDGAVDRSDVSSDDLRAEFLKLGVQITLNLHPMTIYMQCNTMRFIWNELRRRGGAEEDPSWEDIQEAANKAHGLGV